MTSNCLHHELHRAGIDYAIIHGDPSLILLCNLAAGLQKQPGQGFQHIRLVHHKRPKSWSAGAGLSP